MTCVKTFLISLALIISGCSVHIIHHDQDPTNHALRETHGSQAASALKLRAKEARSEENLIYFLLALGIRDSSGDFNPDILLSNNQRRYQVELGGPYETDGQLYLAFAKRAMNFYYSELEPPSSIIRTIDVPDDWNPLIAQVNNPNKIDLAFAANFRLWLSKQIELNQCTNTTNVSMQGVEVDGNRLGQFCQLSSSERGKIKSAARKRVVDEYIYWRGGQGSNTYKETLQNNIYRKFGHFDTSPINYKRNSGSGATNFILLIDLVEPKSAYVIAVDHVFCAQSPQNSLDPKSGFYNALTAKYGTPQPAMVSPKEQMSQSLALLRNLQEVSQKYAVTRRERSTALKLKRDLNMAVDMSSNDQILIGYDWLSAGNGIELRQIGMCTSELPRFAISIGYPEQKYPKELAARMLTSTTNRLDSLRLGAQSNAPLPRF